MPKFQIIVATRTTISDAFTCCPGWTSSIIKWQKIRSLWSLEFGTIPGPCGTSWPVDNLWITFYIF